jgi:molybdate/tungstate transport system substrate-binding protein
MRHIFAALIMILFIFSGCNSPKKKEIIIFRAGSLSIPFREIAGEFEKAYPDVKVLLEPAGSLVCARKVTELKKPCDIVASSDYFVINEMLIPEYASWGIRFATNELVIGYSEKSKYGSEIDSSNWMKILLKPDVIYSRSDPDSDPCGYRTLMLFSLAEKYYKAPGLAEKMINKNLDFIRPKEVDLVALVESNAVDYMFQYKSVIIQHHLRYCELPDQINLASPALNGFYKNVSAEVAGNTPGSKIKVTGEYINYSLTVLDKAPNREEAVKFVEFLISPAGMEIFRKNGQDPIIPFSTEQPEKIPAALLKYLKN